MGDQIYLKLQLYRKTSVTVRRNLKLCSKYYGSFAILDKLGPVAYVRQLPQGSFIHPVFHISQVKKRPNTAAIPNPTLALFGDDGQFRGELVAILDRRIVKGTKCSCHKSFCSMVKSFSRRSNLGTLLVLKFSISSF